MYRRRHRKGGGIKFVGPPSDDVIITEQNIFESEYNCLVLDSENISKTIPNRYIGKSYIWETSNTFDIVSKIENLYSNYTDSIIWCAIRPWYHNTTLNENIYLPYCICFKDLIISNILYNFRERLQDIFNSFILKNYNEALPETMYIDIYTILTPFSWYNSYDFNEYFNHVSVTDNITINVKCNDSLNKNQEFTNLYNQQNISQFLTNTIVPSMALTLTEVFAVFWNDTTHEFVTIPFVSHTYQSYDQDYTFANQNYSE